MRARSEGALPARGRLAAALLRLFARITPLRMLSPRDLGSAGERRAAWFYRLRGFRIAGRNVRLPEGEIDLVARRGRLVVFAEVKSRQQAWAGAPHEAVDRGKQLRIAALARRYLRQKRLEDVVVRFDVVSLFWNGRRFELTHYGDAFRPMADPSHPWRWI